LSEQKADSKPVDTGADKTPSKKAPDTTPVLPESPKAAEPKKEQKPDAAAKPASESSAASLPKVNVASLSESSNASRHKAEDPKAQPSEAPTPKLELIKKRKVSAGAIIGLLLLLTLGFGTLVWYMRLKAAQADANNPERSSEPLA